VQKTIVSVEHAMFPGTSVVETTWVTESWGFLYSRTAYDVANRQDYAFQTTTYERRPGSSDLYLSFEMTMDDGTAILYEPKYFGALANLPVTYMYQTTVKDAQGRTDAVTQDYYVWDHRSGAPQDIRKKSMDYNPNTGFLDYEVIEYRSGPVNIMTVDYNAAGQRDYVIEKRTDGVMVATDYGPATGLLDFVITTSADGRLLAEDYDAAGRLDFVIDRRADGTMVVSDYNSETGLLDFVITIFSDGRLLAEDYDVAGRLDYVIERWADGRMVATDHDLYDQYAWSTHRLAYDAAGRLESVLLL
jgi:hypothetical protein